MVKDDIITAICRETFVSRNTVGFVIDRFCEHIGDAMARGEKVQITGFGTFEPKHRNARVGRNPHTGAAVPISARIIPSFKPGKALNDKVCRNVKK